MTRPVPSKLVDDLVRIRQWSQRAQGQVIPEVDTINVLIGDGTTVLVAGIAAAIRVDFRARITGSFIQEFDGAGSGTVQLDIQKAPAGASPTFASIVASAPPVISPAGRYGENLTLVGWDDEIDRGDILRYHITSATVFKRLLVALRIRRLEP